MQQSGAPTDPHNKQPAARPWRVTLFEAVLLVTLTGIVLAFFVHLFYEMENALDYTTCSDFSPTCDRIVLGRRSSMEVYGIKSGEMICKAPGEVWQVRFSPDGRYVATSYAGAVVELWDASTGQHVRTIGRSPDKAHTTLFEFSSAGDQIIIACGEQIDICDTASGEVQHSVDTRIAVGRLAVSPGGDRFAALSYGRIVLYDMAGNERGMWQENPLGRLNVNNNRLKIPVDAAGVWVWDEEKQQPSQLLSETEFGTSEIWQFSPSQQHLIIDERYSIGGYCELYDRHAGVPRTGIFKCVVENLQFAPDGNLAYALGSNDEVITCKIPTSKRVAEVWLQPRRKGRYPWGAIFVSTLWAVAWCVVARRAYKQDQSIAGLRGYAAVLIAVVSFAFTATVATMRFFPSVESYPIIHAIPARPENAVNFIVILLSICIGVILSFSAIRRKTLLSLISLMLLLLSSTLFYLFVPRF